MGAKSWKRSPTANDASDEAETAAADPYDGRMSERRSLRSAGVLGSFVFDAVLVVVWAGTFLVGMLLRVATGASAS